MFGDHLPLKNGREKIEVVLGEKGVCESGTQKKIFYENASGGVEGQKEREEAVNSSLTGGRRAGKGKRGKSFFFFFICESEMCHKIFDFPHFLSVRPYIYFLICNFSSCYAEAKIAMVYAA